MALKGLGKRNSLENLAGKIVPWLSWHQHDNDPPLRAELFSVEQLAQHAKTLAEHHHIGIDRDRNRLLTRLKKNEDVLRAFNRASPAVEKTRRITPAAEWLFDNFYLIEEQIQTARRHLPRHYSRELPRLISGPSAGLPRIYDLMQELISHSDAQIDAEQLRVFIGAYQAIKPLNLGELWAVPIMLRLGLIENLRRITRRLEDDRIDRDAADHWADLFQSAAENNASNLIVIVAEMARENPPSSSAFVAQFCQRLAHLDPSTHFARNWLEQRLREQGFSIEQLLQAESQSQATDQVSVSHTIASLRFISAMDWKNFVEQLSIMDQTLRNDPVQTYANMDFATRDLYRHAVERLTRESKRPENEVAWKAIELAEQSAREKGAGDRSAHVGYFLVDKGLPALERALGARAFWDTLAEKYIRRFPMTFYAGGIAAMTITGTGLLLWEARDLNIEPWKLWCVAILLVLSLSQLAVALMNSLAASLVQPQRLPRLDFSEGTAPDCRTMVVVPTMLSSITAIERLLETLEIHYLANRDENVYFALLTDFPDAPQATMPDDEMLEKMLAAGVTALNQKYQTDRPHIFFLFHRPRLWNAAEEKWMGYERKRGKLAEFNALLRGRGRERFSLVVGDVSLLPGVRYVITLDTDTQLPRDAARSLVGTISHPLNRPQFHTEKGIVEEGYSILQPRVGVSLPSAGRSWFAKIFAGDAGIDPYTRAVSDIYQDIFNEGSFIGKGIYDVDAFERALHGRFPENTILSHDLIESVHARSALVSDVELFEEHPSRYNADINRRHRWIRGDWQIAQWLLPRIPGPNACAIANPLSGLSQWKIFDNLRRSLVPASLLLLLITGWFLIPQLSSLCPLVVLAIIMLPGVLAILRETLHKPNEWPIGLHLKTTYGMIGRQLAQIALTLAFLPYDAYVSLDAVARTLVRLLVTRKQLLEWQTSSDAERHARTELQSFYRLMWIAPMFAVVVGAWLSFQWPAQLALATPFILLWISAPAIAWWISKPIAREVPRLTENQLVFLRRTARKTWRFFEHFVNETENWLPPDNYQEHPLPVTATRTSPTNIGLSLLSNLAACDFGHIPARKMLERTRNTFATMQKLERHRGHFYNWYDTRTLKAVQPFYISMVDSGNLAGSLLILGSGLMESPDRPIIEPQIFAGLRSTLGVLRELKQETGWDALDLTLAKDPINLSDVFVRLQHLVAEAQHVVTDCAGQAEEIVWWANTFSQSCQDFLNELLELAPWAALLAPMDSPGQTADARFSQEMFAGLKKIPTPREIVNLKNEWDAILKQPASASLVTEFKQLHEALAAGSQRAAERIHAAETLASEAFALGNMDFSFLFDTVRELFTIGYSVSEHRRDASFYDLLASEARLGSYVAIAQGQVPEKHWFTLGRLLASTRGGPVLVSWSGSMFEYLMPMLVMPSYENTLLDQTCRACVRAQLDYGNTRGTPWGISESGYNLTDAQLNYQYRAFGVPGLGFKRGLSDDLVIAPYATVMALMVLPREACENLQRLAAEGRMGQFGFFEAIDYTPARLRPNETSVTIRSFMAHHEGMSYLSLAYLLLERPMQRRFLSHPPLKAEELLLQERIPKALTTLTSEDVDMAESRGLINSGDGAMRIIPTPHTPAPEVHLLSNGRYHVVVSNSGGGYSRWQNLAITRWREDATRDRWGNFCYVRDVESGEFCSVGYQPSLQIGKHYEAIFTQARAEFRQRHGTLEIHAEISVSPEDDVELRRVTLTNHGNTPRVIELTTFAEVVLAPANADVAHPAFSNLFVQTEFVASHQAILCTRRGRSPGEKPPWMFHLIALSGADAGEVSYETDRAKFVGRGRTLESPAALQTVSPLGNSVGAVLDPVVSLRRTVTIPAHQSTQIQIVMGATENREAAMGLVEKYHNVRMADRTLDLAWTHSQVSLRLIDATETEAQLYARMAGALIYARASHRANAAVLMSNRRGQSGLWSYGISGDLPVVVLRMSDAEKMELARRTVRAHAYWRMKGLPVELLIINEDSSVYRQSLQDAIIGLVASGIESQMLDKPGGIFVRRLEQIPAEDRILLQSVARILLSDDKGTLEEQFQRREATEIEIPDLETTRASALERPEPSLPPSDLLFFNGLGGFTPDGAEYVITLPMELPASAPAKALPFTPWRSEKIDMSAGRLDKIFRRNRNRFLNVDGVGKSEGNRTSPFTMTPAPWVNVLANPHFGTLISESGGSYTWSENSHEFRLTPWSNDPVSDISGEAFYIRDEETGEFWSPTPLPARGASAYVVRHGFGYTLFEHTENGIVSELRVFVARNAPVKFSLLKLRNVSGRPRKLAVYGYWEWVLGDLREKSMLHVQTEVDAKSGTFLARNYYNTEFAGRVAFVDVNEPQRTFTGDRREFFGRNGTPANPAALRRTHLSGKVGAGLDPCAAVQIIVELPDARERELNFCLGAGQNVQQARDLARHFRQSANSRVELEKVREYWKRTLGAVQVETPDAATNALANGWLLYQTLSARLWGRTGFYQSGGAFGFRDQLQDAMALVHSEPQLLREQILRAAAHQFREGDVQHWWHPPSDRGVRTHFSDDFLWLPYAVCRYVKGLNDTGVLDENVPFLEGRALKASEESYYDLPVRSTESASLYEHCVRAIENGLKFGTHGLPLIGCGDWNDGFNLIGEHGKGESVWLAFFLHEVLMEFIELARQRSDVARVAQFLTHEEMLRTNIEANAWDGQWYRRAYFDNGEPLGSQTNVECQIDSLPQSWAALTGFADPERTRMAMRAVNERLVRRDASLIQLFDPPFDKSPLNPGYIKGYVPGVRENGGQYTHGAIWVVMAFHQMGENNLGWELLNLLNPIQHALTPAQVATYKVEPYVIAADVYAVNPHVGRGGWTWYTGSAGWMYRLMIESLLGIKLEGEKLRLEPHIPDHWQTFKVKYRFRETTYHLNFKRAANLALGELEIIEGDRTYDENCLPLIDDKRDHTVEIRIGTIAATKKNIVPSILTAVVK